MVFSKYTPNKKPKTEKSIVFMIPIVKRRKLNNNQFSSENFGDKHDFKTLASI